MSSIGHQEPLWASLTNAEKKLLHSLKLGGIGNRIKLSEAEPMEKEKPSIPLDESSEYDLPSSDEKRKTTRMRANTEQPNV
ncbi:hypothetical protein [Bacillus atrophaeus]